MAAGMRYILATLGLLLAGCAASPPLIGNSRGGMVDLSLHYPNSTVQAAADKHCAKYGKQARITSARTLDAHDVLFECT
jgi:starvation-inducible outer membrane lipoprotein